MTAYHQKRVWKGWLFLFSFQFFAYIIVMLSFFPELALALDVTLVWDPSQEDIVGYRLYYGRESRNYSTVIDVGEDTNHRITGLEDDRTYYFAVTAYDSSIRESAYSEEIAYPYTSSMNLIVNSGFEAGALNEWSLDKGIVAVNSQSANTGSYGIKIYGKGSIEQTFSTIKGKTYYVSARMRIDKQIKKLSWGGLIMRIQNVNGGLVARSPIIRLKNSPVGSWTEVRFSFRAKSDTSLLNFRNNGQFEASADDFIVSPISF
jgi:hypothetical protein